MAWRKVLGKPEAIIVVPICWFIVVALRRPMIIVVVPGTTAEHPNRDAPFPSRQSRNSTKVVFFEKTLLSFYPPSLDRRGQKKVKSDATVTKPPRFSNRST